MEYTVWDYFIPSMGVLAAVLVIVPLVNFYLCSIVVKQKRNNKVQKYLPSIYVLSILIIVLAGIYGFSSLSKWASLFDANTLKTITGTVENKKTAGVMPLYFDRMNCRISTPSYITVSGLDYYILSDEGIEVGQTLRLTYTTEGGAVKGWSTNPSADDQEITPDQGNRYHGVGVEGEKEALLKPFHYVILVGIMIAVVGICGHLIASRRIVHQNVCGGTQEGCVCPRKITLDHCWLEWMVSVFAALSLLTKSVPLIIVMISTALCLWGLQFVIQKTVVVFQGDTFTYVTIGVAHSYHISDVERAEFSQTKQGYTQLWVRLVGGRYLRFSQWHFTGLGGFYAWIKQNR